MSFVKALVSLLILVAILALAFAGGAWVYLNNEMARTGPHIEAASFTINRGEGMSGVATRLEAQGVITNAYVFRLAARLRQMDQAIQAGTYNLPARASANAILEQLVGGDVVQLRLTIPEGLTTAQILRRIEAAQTLDGEMPNTEIAEGVLLPDTYIFDVGTTREALLRRMQQAQSDLLAEAWPDRLADLPVTTPQEAIILASIVEKETGKAEERGLIAGLFTGRLQRGMRLESDPTIIYGISQGEPLYNRQGERRTLYRSEINRKTDWNTYQIDGLPKTPICNPGRDAILAVLNPPQTDYVFFVADGRGGHKFAETYREHQKNVADYRAYERSEIARERGH